MAAETYNSSAGRKVTGLTDEHASVELTVNAKSAGTYRLYIGAATSKANAAISVSVNGKAPVDKERLQTLIDYAAAILKDAGHYTAASVKVLEEALASATTVLEDKKATEEEVAEACKSLSDALLGLIPGSDKAELENAIAMAEKILKNADQYTADSLKGLEESLQNVRSICGKEDATQEEVDDALKAMAELTDLEEDAEQAADVTRDGKVGTDDASRILQYAAELVEKF